MPVITLEAQDKKQPLAKKLTEGVAEILNISPPVIYVFLKENEPDSAGVGGKLLGDK